MLKEYTFTIRYQLPVGRAPGEAVERLGALDCDDALIGVGEPGYIALEFPREGASENAAVKSALADVQRAIQEGRAIGNG